MKLSRRTYLTGSAAALLGVTSPLKAEGTDGVGPNRGIASRGFRSKHTCINDAVPVSDSTTRISVPADFGANRCELIEDSFEGPYFTCTPAPGKDISGGQPGQTLTVALRLTDSDCRPVEDGIVDVWACNAKGYYSGYSNDPNKLPPLFRAMVFGHVKPDTADRFCRGALRTDSDGIAEFTTIYPGYYYGQPIHMHFKVHAGGHAMLTSQANFPEQWNEQVMQTQPYNLPRPIKRNSESTDFPTMNVFERENNLVAVLDLVLNK